VQRVLQSAASSAHCKRLKADTNKTYRYICDSARAASPKAGVILADRYMVKSQYKRRLSFHSESRTPWQYFKIRLITQN